jgi:hypothetical protein
LRNYTGGFFLPAKPAPFLAAIDTTKRVVGKDSVYTVADARTHGRNPMYSESHGLMEGITFERLLLWRLSATKTVGV